MWNLNRNDTNEFTYKIERDSQTQKTNLWLPGGKDSQGVWEGHVHTAIFKMDNQGPIVLHMEFYSMLYARLDGVGFGGEWIHVYVLFLCCLPETITTLLTGYTPIQNKKFKV